MSPIDGIEFKFQGPYYMFIFTSQFGLKRIEVDMLSEFWLW